MRIKSSHTSRASARKAARRNGGKVVRGGCFANGSFGLYPRMKSNGQYVGGPAPLLNVWHVAVES